VVGRALRLIAAGMALAAVAAGCGTGYNYVKSSSDRTYFKVPDRWTLYDEGAVMERLGGDLSKQQRSAELGQTWRVAFDAAPKPSLNHLASVGAAYPSGLAVVRRLSFDAADNLSTASMRNYFFDVDGALQNNAVDVTQYEELELEGGFRGIHMVARLTRSSGDVLTIDQTTLVDQGNSKIYALLVSCSSSCYAKNRHEIENVVDSWTVRAK
jgi:hypothetical protein